MKKKILIVVDCQYDFINPDGALYVNGAEKIENKVLDIIKDFDLVIFTQDYHPLSHCSFKENGGIWPIHCVCDTIGCGIPVKLFKESKDYYIEPKGNSIMHEEYGAFSSIENFSDILMYAFHNYCKKEPLTYIKDIDEIVICGVAGDYCVLETLKNIIEHIGTKNISIYIDGIASIDGGKKLNNYIKENNIKIYCNDN